LVYASSAMPLIRIGLWILLLVTATLLPFFPGRHDPAATSLALGASVASFGGLLLVPIGAAWLAIGHEYTAARTALLVAAGVVGLAALGTATESLVAFEHPSTALGAREVVMYNPAGEQDFSSHVLDLLELSAEQIRSQRGYFTSEALAQPRWKRFLFD
jgi:hypothetical protein